MSNQKIFVNQILVFFFVYSFQATNRKFDVAMNFEKFSQTTAYFRWGFMREKGSDIAEKKHNPRVICGFWGIFFGNDHYIHNPH